MPALRERLDDIPALAKYFLDTIGRQQNLHVTISKDAIEALRTYDFPGNVRELQSILQRSALFCEGSVITVNDLSLSPRPSMTVENEIQILRDSLESARRELETLREATIPADPIWEGKTFPAENDYCFVLMPFTETSDVQSVYRDHVAPVVERCGLRCERADDIYDISGVMQSVWEGINRARMIVADLTERNPNVFYELGIAHTLGKAVIMITQSMEFIPFDLRHLRCIVYEYKPNAVGQFEEALERTIRTVLSSINRSSRRS